MNNPPISPLTGKSIQTCYRPGQRPGSVFGELKQSIEECRAETIEAYLAFDTGIVSIIGYSEESHITIDESECSLIYP